MGGKFAAKKIFIYQKIAFSENSTVLKMVGYVTNVATITIRRNSIIFV